MYDLARAAVGPLAAGSTRCAVVGPPLGRPEVAVVRDLLAAGVLHKVVSWERSVENQRSKNSQGRC